MTNSVSIYGPALTAYSLANLENWKDRRQDISWLAPKTGIITHITVFLKSDLANQSKPGSYSGGNGGQIFVSAHADINGLPAEHILSCSGLLLSNPVNLLANNTQALYLPLSLNLPVTAGQRYHFIFENTDPNSAHNFVSINTFKTGNPDGTSLIANPQTSYSYMISEANAPWQQRLDHVPIFAVYYDDESCYGQGYSDVAAQSGLLTTDQQVIACEFFTPKINIPVSTLHIFYNNQWNVVPWSGDSILQAGKSYIITVPNGVQVYPIVKSYFPVTDNIFTDGYYGFSLNAGKTWTKYLSPVGIGNRDLPFYFDTL